MNDPVTHPAHYCTGKYECIEVMTEVFGVEDIKKANWYLTRFLMLEELKNEKNTDTV